MVDEHSSVRWSKDVDNHRLLPALGRGTVEIEQGKVADLMAALKILPGQIPYHLGSFWCVRVCEAFLVKSTTVCDLTVQLHPLHCTVFGQFGSLGRLTVFCF